jgi:hypothetical protein
VGILFPTSKTTWLLVVTGVTTVAFACQPLRVIGQATRSLALRFAPCKTSRMGSYGIQLFVVWTCDEQAALELIGFSETVAERVFLYSPADDDCGRSQTTMFMSAPKPANGNVEGKTEEEACLSSNSSTQRATSAASSA